MNLDDCMITCFCLIDEMTPMMVKDQRLRARDPAPKLLDSEVITMEVVGSYLGLSQDQELFDYFRRHHTHFFPRFRDLHRRTFVRQAANLWAVKERLWCWLRDELISYDPCLSIMPLPVCRFARASCCVRFRGVASYGKDHAVLSWPGLLTRMFLVPVSVTDGEIVPILLEGTTGVVLGDRTYWLPDLQAFLRTKGMVLQVSFRQAHSRHPPQPTRVRCWDGCATSSTSNAGQLTDRCQMKRVWARDVWHLRTRRFALHFDAYGLLLLQSARSGSSSSI